MLYDDELYMLKSNKIYVMLCYVIKKMTLKGTATLMITMFGMKDLNKP